MPDYITGAIVVLILIPIVIFAHHKYSQSRRKLQPHQNPYQGLRDQALRMTPDLLQLNASHSRSPYGLLMELGVKGGTASLVVYSDGNASIYFSSGAGVIGGFAHQAVREAALRFITSASKYLPGMIPVSEYSRPIQGNATFFALTDQGVLTITANEKQLQEKLVNVWPLYYLGQGVITELRKLTPDQK